MSTRKSVEILITLVCVIALTFGLTGCRKKLMPPDTGNDDTNSVDVTPVEIPTTQDPEPVLTPPTLGELEIVPLKGVGPIQFGISKERAIELLGEPEKDEGGISLFYLKSRGLSLLFDFRSGLSEIHCWSTEYPDPPPELVTFEGKTDKGIEMGATRDQIVAEYGEPDKVIPKGPINTLRYNNLRMDFDIHEGKLISMKVKASRPTL